MAWTYVGGTTSSQLTSTASGASVSLPGGSQAADVVVYSTYVNCDVSLSVGALVLDTNAAHVLIDSDGRDSDNAKGTMKWGCFGLSSATNPTFSNNGFMVAGDYGYVRLDVFRSSVGSPIPSVKRRNAFSGGAVKGDANPEVGGTGETITITQDPAINGTGVLAFMLGCWIDDTGTSISAATDTDGNTYVEAVELKDTTSGGLHFATDYDLTATVTTTNSQSMARVGGSGTPDILGGSVYLWEADAQTNYTTGMLTKTPSFVAASTAQVISTNTTTTINMPAGITDGDVFLVLTSGNLPAGSVDLYFGGNTLFNPATFTPPDVALRPFIYWANQGGLFLDTTNFGAGDVYIVQVFAFRNIDHRVEKSDFTYGHYYAFGDLDLNAGTATNMTVALRDPTSWTIYADKLLHFLGAAMKDDWTSVAIGNANPGVLDWTERADSATTTGDDAGIAAYTAIQTTDLGTLNNETITVTGGASAAYQVEQIALPAEPLGTRKRTAPTFVAAGALSGPANTGTLTPALPAGIAAGDLLVLCAGGYVTGDLADTIDFVSTESSPGVGGTLLGWTVYNGSTTPDTTITPTGNAVTDNWWARVLAFRGLAVDNAELWTAFRSGTSDNPTLDFAATHKDLAPGIGIAVFGKADDNSSITTPGVTDGVQWVDHTNATTTTNSDATMLISYFINNTEGLAALDTDPVWTWNGGASAAYSALAIYFLTSPNQLYYENTESGTTAATSAISHSALVNWVLSLTTAATSAINGSQVVNWITSGTTAAASTVASSWLVNWILSSTTAATSAISHSALVNWITSGTTAATFALSHSALVNWITSGTTAVTSAINGSQLVNWITSGTTAASSAIAGAEAAGRAWAGTTFNAVSTVTHTWLTSFSLTGVIAAVSGITHSLLTRLLGTPSSEWGNTGGGGRRSLRSDRFRAILNRRRRS